MVYKTTRRGFVRQLTWSAVGAASLLRLGMWAHGATSSRVAVARHSGIITPDGERDRVAMEQSVDAAMASLTGETDSVAAWRSLFEPDDVVGLKVNCLAGYGLSTHPTLTAVVADRLQEAGLLAENIVVWDRTDRELIQAGYEINWDAPGVQCVGTEQEYSESIEQGQWRGRLSRVITDHVTALINLPIVKHHYIVGSTLSLKNHFGSIDNPRECHGDGADPFITDVNLIPAVREKQRLVIADATLGCYDGGPRMNPQFLFEPRAIMAATDPVAIDYQAWQMIEAAREQNGLATLEAQDCPPTYIATSAAVGLGTNDPDSFELAEIDVG